MRIFLLFLFILNSNAFGMAGGKILTSGDPAARSVLGIHIYDKSKKTGAMCTGTIIGKQTVITAAHCFDKTNPKDVDITLAFGSKPYLIFIDKEAQKNPDNYRRTNLFLINPSYKLSSPVLSRLANDVALIYLKPNEFFPPGYESLSVVHAYTLFSQPEKGIVNGVGRTNSDESEAKPEDLVFKTDTFTTIRDVNLVLNAVGAISINDISDNVLNDFGSSNSPYYLAYSQTAVLHKGDSGSALIQNYFGSLRVIGILKGSLILGTKDFGSAFSNLHQPQLNRWIHNNIK